MGTGDASDPDAHQASGESAESHSTLDTVKIKAKVEEVMRKAAVLVRAAGDLPRRGDDYELCNSFSAFTAFMEQQETRIQLMLTNLMRNAGCPTRMPKINSDADEYLGRIVMVDDHVVERAGIIMDELDRDGRDDVDVPKTIIGAESTKRKKAEAEAAFQERIQRSDPGSVLAEQLRLAHQEAKAAKVANLAVKPQKEYGFETCIDNSPAPFVPRLRTKHNAIPRKDASGIVLVDEDFASSGKHCVAYPNYELDENLHPYQLEIRNFIVPKNQLESKAAKEPLPINVTPLTFVRTKEQLEKLRNVLNECIEFAVDLEHHDYRSYLGFICLMQVSTRTEDYIIDVFPLWNEMHILNEPFTNPKILKVFHGAECDIEWLQRDFGIYVVNMFDTGRAMRLLEMQKLSLRYLVRHYCNIKLDKKYQLADWRVRPLNDDMVVYARSDTHYLLYCYDCLREELLERDIVTQRLLRAAYSESSFICLRTYRKPSFDKNGFRGLERRRLNNRQNAALCALWRWRDRVAREEDESVQYVMPNHILLTIAESLPRELQGILQCCNPMVPPLVRECAHELHKMIFKCRDIPLVEYTNEKANDDYDQLVRQRNMKGQYTKENIFDICPLDFSQTGINEENGDPFLISKMNDSAGVTECRPAHTLMAMLNSVAGLDQISSFDNSTCIVSHENDARSAAREGTVRTASTSLFTLAPPHYD